MTVPNLGEISMKSLILLVLLGGMLEQTPTAKDWTGTTVILKQPGVKIGYTGDDGKQVIVAELTSMSYVVLAQHDGFLKVNQRGSIGWFAKSQALSIDDAIAFFGDLARRSGPKDGVALAFLGWAHKEKKNTLEAVKAYDEAIRRDPKAVWFNNRGLIQKEAKNHDAAVADFGEALRLDPKMLIALENRAATYTLLKNADAALKDWSEVIRKDTKHSAAMMNRAKIRSDLGEYEKALADVSEVINLEKINPEPFVLRAHIQTAMKEYAASIADLTEALRLAPKHADARITRGWNQFLLGKFADANKDFETALVNEPELGLAYNCQAWLWATCSAKEFRNGKKALDYAKKAVNLSGGKDPGFLDTLAAAHAEVGDFAQAVTIVESVVAAAMAANDVDLLAEARERLALYKKKKPYRQPIAK